jgi:hypothetical protein
MRFLFNDGVVAGLAFLLALLMVSIVALLTMMVWPVLRMARRRRAVPMYVYSHADVMRPYRD